MTVPSFIVIRSLTGSYLPCAKEVDTSPMVMMKRSLLLLSSTRAGIILGHSVTGPGQVADCDFAFFCALPGDVIINADTARREAEVRIADNIFFILLNVLNTL